VVGVAIGRCHPRHEFVGLKIEQRNSMSRRLGSTHCCCSQLIDNRISDCLEHRNLHSPDGRREACG
jgi:hypothetical protein